MSQLYDFAQWAGITPATERNPISLVKVEHATRRRKPRSLTVEEFQRILNHLKEPLRSIAIVAVSLGLRASEVLGLKWKHVDWLNSRLAVEQRIYRQQVDYTKTRGSSGELNVDASVLQVLKDLDMGEPKHSSGDYQSPIRGSGAASTTRQSEQESARSERIRFGTRTARGWTRWEHPLRYNKNSCAIPISGQR